MTIDNDEDLVQIPIERNEAFSGKPFLRMSIFTWCRGPSLVLTLKGLTLAQKPGEYAIIKVCEVKFILIPPQRFWCSLWKSAVRDECRRKVDGAPAITSFSGFHPHPKQLWTKNVILSFSRNASPPWGEERCSKTPITGCMEDLSNAYRGSFKKKTLLPVSTPDSTFQCSRERSFLDYFLWNYSSLSPHWLFLLCFRFMTFQTRSFNVAQCKME